MTQDRIKIATGNVKRGFVIVMRLLCKLARSFSGEILWITLIIFSFNIELIGLAWFLITVFSLNIIDALFFNFELQEEMVKLWKPKTSSKDTMLEEYLDGETKKK